MDGCVLMWERNVSRVLKGQKAQKWVVVFGAKTSSWGGNLLAGKKKEEKTIVRLNAPYYKGWEKGGGRASKHVTCVKQTNNASVHGPGEVDDDAHEDAHLRPLAEQDSDLTRKGRRP